MPLSRANLHRFELPSALLERGFWLYVWKIQQRKNTPPIFYVGMTGDTGSYSPQSPMKRYSEKRGIDLNSCKIEFAAYGPISKACTDDKALYSSERQKVAALEKALWLAMYEGGHDMLNDCPKCAISADPTHLAIVRKEFAPLIKL